MLPGRVAAIFIAPTAGAPMQWVREVRAIAGAGLEGDRYATGEGSFGQNTVGKRQVTLINAAFFPGTGFNFSDSRRNIITINVELMRLIGQEFTVGKAKFRGVKYCEPCNRPSRHNAKRQRFADLFEDRGGLVAEVLETGIIAMANEVIPPPKNYTP